MDKLVGFSQATIVSKRHKHLQQGFRFSCIARTNDKNNLNSLVLVLDYVDLNRHWLHVLLVSLEILYFLSINFCQVIKL